MADTDTEELASAELVKENLALHLGSTGVTFFDGVLTSSEFNTKFSGMAGAAIYDQMRRTDGQTRATLTVQSLPIHAATWGVKCESESIQEELKEQLFTRLNWDEFLRHFLMILPFGFTVMEMVWALDKNRYWIKKLAHRAQTTIKGWVVDEDTGELTGIKQQVAKGWTTTEIEIPAWKIFRVALQQEGNNFEGISILRSAYKHWYFKEMVEKIDGIAQERWGLGIPYAQAPESGYSSTDVTEAKKSLRNLRAGAQSLLFIPFGWDIGVKGAGEGSRLDPIPTIRYHNEQIALNSLAMFLLLGTTSSGSRALGGTHLDMFYNAEEALADMIVAEVNKQIIDPWLRVNYPDGENIKATLTWADLQVRNVESISEAINKLAAKGFLTPDAETENLLRDQLNLPAKEEEDIEKDRSKLPDSPVLQAENLDPDIPLAASRRNHPHSHKHKRNADGYWRDLSPSEMSMALGEIEGRQDDAEDEIADIFKAIKPSWIDSLISDLVEAESPRDILKVTIPKNLRHAGVKETVEIQREIYAFGRRSVKDEQKRQERKEKVDPDEAFSWARDSFEVKQSKRFDSSFVRFSEGRSDDLEAKELTEQWWVRGQGMYDRLSSRIENVAKDRVLAIQRNYGDAFDAEDLEDLAEDLTDMFDDAARLEGRGLVANAYGLGRMAEAAIRKEDIRAAVYSAILDQRTCEVCARFDGETYTVGNQDYHADSPPNPNCLSSLSGVNKCRCLWVYTFRSEGR